MYEYFLFFKYKSMSQFIGKYLVIMSSNIADHEGKLVTTLNDGQHKGIDLLKIYTINNLTDALVEMHSLNKIREYNDRYPEHSVWKITGMSKDYKIVEIESVLGGEGIALDGSHWVVKEDLIE